MQRPVNPVKLDLKSKCVYNNNNDNDNDNLILISFTIPHLYMCT